MTILDAVVDVLKRSGTPLSGQEIYRAIVAHDLFTFRATDPVAMVRSAIRKHLRPSTGTKLRTVRLRQVERDRFTLP